MPDEIIVDADKRTEGNKITKIRFIYRGNNVYIEENGVEKLLKVDDEYVGEFAQPISQESCPTTSTRKKVTREQLEKLVELIRKN